MSGRTEEQIAADEALTAAIDRALASRGFTDDGEVSLEYIVIVAQQKWEEDGLNDSFCTLYRDGHVATTRAIGLLYAATETLKPELQR